MTLFDGYRFDQNSDSGREKIQIKFDQHKIQWISESNSESINWQDLKIENSGNNYKTIFFKSNSNPSIIFFTLDKNIIKSIQEQGGVYAIEALKNFRKENDNRRSKSSLLIFSAILLISLLAAIPYLFYQPIKNAALNAIPLEMEEKIGNLAFENFTKDSEKVTDPIVIEAIETILKRFKDALKKDKDQPQYNFEIAIIKSSEVNAFALPGGKIVIYTGLIEKSKNVEEVAGVLAHEIAHVTKRHGLERVISGLGIVVLAQLVLGDISGSLEIIIEGAELISIAQFSQHQESEADAVGFELLKNSAIDPRGLASFFQKLEDSKSESNQSAEELIGLISTHPSNNKRIEALNTLIQKSPYKSKPLNINWESVKEAIK